MVSSETFFYPVTSGPGPVSYRILSISLSAGYLASMDMLMDLEHGLRLLPGHDNHGSGRLLEDVYCPTGMFLCIYIYHRPLENLLSLPSLRKGAELHQNIKSIQLRERSNVPSVPQNIVQEA